MPTAELREAWVAPEIPEVQEARRELLEPRRDLSQEDRLLRLEALVENLRRGDCAYADWHEVGTAGEPAFENSWVNFGGDYETAAYRRDGLGLVHIKGLVKSGTAMTVFVLPVGFRPTKVISLMTVANDAVAKLLVYPDGRVRAGFGSNVWFSINCSFFADAAENLLFR